MAVTARRRVPHHSSWTREYWIARCEGYRVDSPSRHLGFVEEVVQTPGGEPRALTVRAGYGRDGLLVVPIEHVLEIVPDSEHIRVRTPRGSSAAPDVRGTTDRRSVRAPMARSARAKKLPS